MPSFTEIAEKAGEEKADKISESLSDVREKASRIAKILLGTPEATKEMIEVGAQKTSEVVRDTTEKIFDAWDRFNERVSEAKEALIERFETNKRIAMEKTVEFGKRAAKVGLGPLVWVEKQVSNIYEVPKAMHGFKADIIAWKQQRREAQSKRNIEDIEEDDKRLKEQMQENNRRKKLEKVDIRTSRFEAQEKESYHRSESKRYGREKIDHRKIWKFTKNEL